MTKVPKSEIRNPKFKVGSWNLVVRSFLFITILTLIQLLILLGDFSSPLDFFGKEPIYTDDYSVEYYWAHFIREVFPKFHSSWAYDPYFMAGYPLDHIFNSTVIFQVYTLLFRPLSIAWAQKSFLLLVVLLLPTIIYTSMRGFGLGAGESMVGSVLGMMVFNLDQTAIMANAGMMTGLLVSYLFLLPLALFYKYLKSRGERGYTACLITLSIAIMTHKSTFAILPIPMLIIYLWNIRGLPWRVHIQVIILGCVAAASNIFWLYPLIKLLHYKTTIIGASFWVSPEFIDPIKTFLGMGPFSGTNIVRMAVIFFSIYAIFNILYEKRGIAGNTAESPGLKIQGSRPPFTALSICVVYLFLLSYLGHVWSLSRSMTPYRYLVCAYFMLTPIASSGLYALSERISRRFAKSGVLIFILSGLICILGLTRLNSFHDMFDHHPLTAKMDTEGEMIINWINQGTDRGGRILIEDSGAYDREGYGHKYFFTHFPAILPVLVKREFIGGPHPYYYISHHFVSSRAGIFLGREIEKYTPDQLKDNIDLYNIHWIVCWSNIYKGVFDKYQTLFRRDGGVGDFNFYKVKTPSNYFYKGSGVVEADYNRLELTQVVPMDGEVILKYHWFDTFVSDPPLTLNKVMIGDDPVGFIRVIDPPENFVIYNSYKWP